MLYLFKKMKDFLAGNLPYLNEGKAAFKPAKLSFFSSMKFNDTR